MPFLAAGVTHFGCLPLPAGPVMADLLHSMMQPHLQQQGQPAVAGPGAAASAGLQVLGLAPRWAPSAAAARPLGPALAASSSTPGLTGMGQPGGLPRAAGQAGPLSALAGQTGAPAAPGWAAAVRPQQGPVRPQLQGRGRGLGRRPWQALGPEALAHLPGTQSLGPGQQQRPQSSRGAEGLQALVEQARRQHPARFGAGSAGAPAAAAAEPEDSDMLR